MQPILKIRLGSIELQTWGTLFALGILVAFWVFLWLAKKRRLPLDLSYNIFFISFFSALIGGRLFFFVVHPELFSWPGLLNFFEGGYVLFGAIFFAFLATSGYIHLQKIDRSQAYQILDLLTLSALIALIFMRLGGWLVQDNIGKTSTVPWAINFLGEKRHPVDLYFLVLDLYLVLFFAWLIRLKRKMIFAWIVLFLAIGRLIIHQFMVFASDWDRGCDLIFWTLTIIGILALLGQNYQFSKNS